MRRDNLEDFRTGDRLVLFGQQILQCFFGQVDAEPIAGERCERNDAIEVTLELANVRSHALGDE